MPKCAVCENEIGPRDRACPHCGRPVGYGAPRQFEPLATANPLAAPTAVDLPQTQIDADTAAEIRRLLADGEKFEAVRRLREATGLGLAAAKAAAEALAGEGVTPATPQVSIDPRVLREVQMLLMAGNKIAAISRLRAATGLGPMEAKAVVDRLAAGQPADVGCATAVLLLVFLAALLLTAGLCRAAEPGVTLTVAGQRATLANAEVTAEIDLRNGDIAALRYRNLDLLAGGSGYWSFVGNSSTEARLGRYGGKRSVEVRLDPAKNGGERAEIAVKLAADGRPETLPADVELRYSLGRADHGLYCATLWRHAAGWSPFSVGEARLCLKLNPGIFDYLAVDAKRRRIMPTGSDWDHGEPVNLKEARRLTTGRYKGQVEHKYDYSAILTDTPAWGWCSTGKQVGMWIINPSMEYMSSGPTHVDLTGHLDGNRGGLPTLLNMWIGSHYGGGPIVVERGQEWRKLVGPFLLYLNGGAEPDDLWRDALRQAAVERAAWPLAWVTDPEYPLAAGRGAVTGRLVVRDEQAPTVTAASAWVGLTTPPHTAHDPGGQPVEVDWQREGSAYQYWARADAAGRFTVPSVRPGKYMLYAISDGVLGEFQRADVTVAAGAAIDLGELSWEPKRFGRQLWQIGLPDRSADKFRHGDDYWHWGLYDLYPKEFPDDVNFVIGASDPKRDWNYCQPARLGADGQYHDTTWRITFEQPAALAGKATLRLAICGSREGGRVWVSVNDREVGDTGPLPNSGVMHRDGIMGYWTERDIGFDAGLLRPGTNVMKLRARGDSWVQGVLYDCVRLEVAEAAPAGH
jgi:rhamnogalacturonan endolyase